MINLISPPDIGVRTPSSRDLGSNHGVPMTTAFFRYGSYLPEALFYARQLSGHKQVTKVMSIGCSIGAEADSTVALHEAQGYEGHIEITGFDLNVLALRTAVKGLYEVREAYREPQLKELGFKTDRDNSTGELSANSQSLRQNHEVNFLQHDVTKPLPVDKADLALINNVLYYLKEEEAQAALGNAAEALNDKGVLAVGLDGFINDGRQARAVKFLKKNFRLEPVLMGSRLKRPVMFTRA